jgi:anti-sigma factor RsiW
MAPDQQRLTTAERENLVAYLDGELKDVEARALATKLTQSVSARREVEALERAWELLDYLPRPKAPEDFASRTLTQISQLAARDGKMVGLAGRAARRAARLLVCLAVATMTLVLGYVLTRWVWPDRTARLVRDLPLAEHLDEYRDVGSFEFLQQLDQAPED